MKRALNVLLEWLPNIIILTATTLLLVTLA